MNDIALVGSSTSSSGQQQQRKTAMKSTKKEKRSQSGIRTYRRKYHVRALCQSVAFVCVVAAFCFYNGLQKYDMMVVDTGDNSYSSSAARLLGLVGFHADTSTAFVGSDTAASEYRRLHEITLDPKQEGGDTTKAPANSSGNGTELDANGFTATQSSSSNQTEAGEQECDDDAKADPEWLIVFHSIGVLYMFLALAIVCDEFFVPALEEMSSNRRMNLSMDVAGATLMAAGGSAPELFTSLFGTFAESAVGFGTIVGSAVFNVLFVIAMCALMSKEVLALTWWPLFRDSTYYALGLGVLAIFVGVTSENEIEIWEAIILFILYLGYIVLMWQNANIYKAITGQELEYPDSDEDGDDGDGDGADQNGEIGEGGDPERPRMPRRLSAGQIGANMKTTDSIGHFRWQGTFRAGILKLLRDPESWIETAGVGIVAKIAGDADYVFRQIDSDGNGNIDKDELKKLFEVLECNLSQTELDQVFAELDENGDGTVRLHSCPCFVSAVILFLGFRTAELTH